MRKTSRLANHLPRIKLGPTGQKILLLLAGGLALSLTRRPDHYFRIVRDMARAWRHINEESLHRAIKRLYWSKLVATQEGRDGTVTLALTEEGKRRIVRYHLSRMEIPKPKRWDGLWRLVVFDIPEHRRRERNFLAGTLKQLGFVPLQKSVFVFPYDSRESVKFLVDYLNLRPYVRLFLVKETDIDQDLRHRFRL